jgi:NADPH:quinone reductase
VSGAHRVSVVSAVGVEQVLTSLDGVTERFDLILEGVGGPVLAEAIRHLAPGGTVVSYGMAGGQKTDLAFTDFRGATNGRLVGFFVYATDIRTFGEDLGFMARLIGEVRLTLPGPRRDWKQTRQAIDLLRRREATGKVVLTRRES